MKTMSNVVENPKNTRNPRYEIIEMRTTLTSERHIPKTLIVTTPPTPCMTLRNAEKYPTSSGEKQSGEWSVKRFITLFEPITGMLRIPVQNVRIIRFLFLVPGALEYTLKADLKLSRLNSFPLSSAGLCLDSGTKKMA